MERLNKQVFITIFTILSSFILVGFIMYNVSSYKKEYDSIKKSLNYRESFGFNKFPFMEEDKVDNVMILDHEVYTVYLNNNGIERIIGHYSQDSSFDYLSVANEVLSQNKKYKIGNLYFSKYAYNYQTDNIITIVNTDSVNTKLSLLLYESILLFLIVEILIYFISKFITKWITAPAIESFNKQKEFIADASHELKTPLAVIMASSDELKNDKKNSKYIDNIKYETERMNKLIASLLDLSKLDNNNHDDYKNENISKIIEKICLTFEGVAFEKGVIIDTNIEDNVNLNCQKDDIEKLVSIIIDNAIKHSYDNKPILVNLSKDKNNIKLDITNTGDPITPGDEDKIFERFYRADKSRNRDAGRYGLGLAIAKRIVINHNGTVKAYSKNDKTTFEINLKK